MTAPADTGLIVPLDDRGVLQIDGSDALNFLNNIVSGSMPELLAVGGGHTALLSPQGKILLEFFVAGSPTSILIDVAAARESDLQRRLALYVLRAKVRITDVTADYTVAEWWGPDAPKIEGARILPDPRIQAAPARQNGGRRVGRMLLARSSAEATPGGIAAGGTWQRGTPADYLALRVAHGIAEGGIDYPLGDTFPHEANLDLTGGVAFDKGCFIGQEVVARMQHKSVVRKRVVRVSGGQPLPEGHPEVTIEGGAAIGRLGSVAGPKGLAMMRLDRAAEAAGEGRRLIAGGVALTVDDGAMARYREAVAARGVAAP